MIRITRQLIAAFLLVFVFFNAPGQEIAAFKLPQTPREFMFQFKLDKQPSVSIEGIKTVFAKRFSTIKTNNQVKITFTDVLGCSTQPGTNAFSFVTAQTMELNLPLTTKVLVKGKWIRLVDLDETTFSQRTETYTGQVPIVPPPGPPPNP
jgi:hypothetical protein